MVFHMAMLFRHRHRRTQYPMAKSSGVPLALQRLLVLAVLAGILWLLFKGVTGLFGWSGSLDRMPTSLTTEPKGLINVSLQGAELQPAEDGMMLFPSDSLKTGPNAHASLSFFDQTLARLDASTDVLIDESGKDSSSSQIRLTVREGGLWITTPRMNGSGSVVRRLAFPKVTFDLPGGAEVIATGRSIAVYAADGQGVAVTLGDKDPFYIGEGQQWEIPEGAETMSDPYSGRSPLGPTALSAPLLTESRILLLGGRAPSEASAPRSGSGDVLTLREPATGATVSGDVVSVKGTVNPSVTGVQVNGHKAILDIASGIFALDLALPDGETEFEIGVDALGENGKTLATIKRIVKLKTASDTTDASSPTIEEPAKAGETFKTNREEVVLTGKAPVNATDIFVNGYKLLLFKPEKGEWSYIASLRLSNMKAGSNTYDVVATFADGSKSPAARLTIVQGQGDEGVVGSSASVGSTGSAASASSTQSSVALVDNAPLTPGILAVTGPTPGASHTETGTGFLLEGKTSKGTDSIWINDYRLQLYKPGVTFWNYVADVSYGNLKSGTNAYEIVARNAKGEVLDRLTYTVEYQPSAGGTSSSRRPRNRSSASSAVGEGTSSGQ